MLYDKGLYQEVILPSSCNWGRHIHRIWNVYVFSVANENEIIRTTCCLQKYNLFKYLPSKQYEYIFFFLRNCSLQPFHIFLLEKLPSKTHFKSHSIYNQDLKFRYVATGCKSKWLAKYAREKHLLFRLLEQNFQLFLPESF